MTSGHGSIFWVPLQSGYETLTSVPRSMGTLWDHIHKDMVTCPRILVITAHWALDQSRSQKQGGGGGSRNFNSSALAFLLKHMTGRLIDGVANVHTVPKEKWCPHLTVRIWLAVCPFLSGWRIKTVSGFCNLATRWSSQPYKYLSHAASIIPRHRLCRVTVTKWMCELSTSQQLWLKPLGIRALMSESLKNSIGFVNSSFEIPFCLWAYSFAFVRTTVPFLLRPRLRQNRVQDC